MKPVYAVVLLIHFALITALTNAQSANGFDPVIPFRTDRSVLFGKDIVINNEPQYNQPQVAVCSAFNGWLFAVYSYIDSINEISNIKISRSTDNGISWTQIKDEYLGEKSLTSLDIEAIGDSVSNLKVLVAFVSSGAINPLLSGGGGYVMKYNGTTGDFEGFLISGVYATCIAMASDYLYPAISSNPHSLCIIYSARYVWAGGIDSLYICTSSDGGHSISKKSVIATSTNLLHEVDIAYGRSSTMNSGRYYAVWEEQTYWNYFVGHIFTSHSEPNFNSPFTKSVKLDSIDPSALNNARFPVIACQYNNTDNDSSNITEMILFDKYIPSENRFDVAGYYNLQSTNSNHFTPFTINSTSDYRISPSVAFNPYTSKFMLTYYDSTNQKLPFLQHDFNMTGADNWEVVSQGYNDSSNLSSPQPKVVYNPSQKQGMNVWSSEGQASNGIALFDAQYLTTGISSNDLQGNDLNVQIYPNPCTSAFNISFCLGGSEHVTIKLYDIYGQSMGIITDKIYNRGMHVLNNNVTGFAPGTYMVKVRTEKANRTFKFVKVD
jgi:hypothetical protein